MRGSSCVIAVASKFFLTLAALSLTVSAWSADMAVGRAKAVQCATCHGMNGIATLPGAPNLAGQDTIYLAKALRDFKSGARKDEMMSLMAANLSDTDIENLAAFYGGLECKPE